MTSQHQHKPPGTHILIVEDSPTQAFQLKFLLESHGYRCTVAVNGEDGLAAARRTSPTLIISDIVMPVMDGYAMCHAVKDDPVLQHIPVILLTSLADSKDLLLGLEAKADYYLTKPYDEVYLLSRIQDIQSSAFAPEHNPTADPIEIVYAGKRHTVASDRRQILSLLMSTYENAVQRNLELVGAQEELKAVNDALEEKVRELVASEDRFRGLVMTIPDIVYRIDPNGLFMFINDAIRRLGYEPEELVGAHFSKLILPADLDDVSSASVLPKYRGKMTGDQKSPKLFDERRTGPRRTKGLEVRLKPKHKSQEEPGLIETIGDDQIVVDINSSGMYEVNPANQKTVFIGTVGVIRDISLRKKIETALKESEERLQTILDRTQAGILVIDADTRRIVEANPAALSFIGMEREQVIGSRCNRVLCAPENDLCPVLDLGQEIDNAERTLLHADGGHLAVLKTVAPITLNGKPHLLESFVDIRKLKEAENQLKASRDELEIKVEERTAELKNSQAKLIQTEMVAAIGTLTAGIAHELNNPMMGMLNFIQYCRKHTDKDHRNFEVLEDAEKETRRCIEIVKNLLTFSRIENQEEEKPSAVDLRILFDRVCRLLSYRLEKENVSIVQTVPETMPMVFARENSIQQVILNLVGNALDAVTASDAKEIQFAVAQTNGGVSMCVTDTGCGMSPETVRRVFDPFYTTKPPGQGTGLGMSVSQSIILEHGGTISCRSEVGKGTAFEILLPAGD